MSSPRGLVEGGIGGAGEVVVFGGFGGLVREDAFEGWGVGPCLWALCSELVFMARAVGQEGGWRKRCTQHNVVIARDGTSLEGRLCNPEPGTPLPTGAFGKACK